MQSKQVETRRQFIQILQDGVEIIAHFSHLSALGNSTRPKNTLTVRTRDSRRTGDLTGAILEDLIRR